MVGGHYYINIKNSKTVSFDTHWRYVFFCSCRLCRTLLYTYFNIKAITKRTVNNVRTFAVQLLHKVIIENVKVDVLKKKCLALLYFVKMLL